MKTVSGEDRLNRGATGFRGNIAVIAGSGATKSFGARIISTYVALYFVGIGGDPITLGLMTSIASVIQCGTLFLGGIISDHYGRRRSMVLAAFYSVLFPVFYAIVQDWRIFMVLTVVAAFEAVSHPASRAIVADSLPSEKRTTGIATLQVVSSFPVIFAPLIGGWLIEAYGLIDGFRLACIYTTATALVSALIIFFFLKETMPDKAGQKPGLLSDEVLRDFAERLRQLPRSLRALLVSYSLVTFANGLVGQYYILYAASIIGLSELDWGIVVSLQFLVANILWIPGGWISDKVGKRKVMILSVLTCAPCTIIFALSQSFVQAAIAGLLLIATGIYYAPAHEALQADLTPKVVRGRIVALWGIGNAISVALGALVGGFLYQLVSPEAPFYVFTAVELTAAFLIISFVREPSVREA
ncbi:MAG: MFS transporter [Candidatus Bathyarchaeota archaeon]|nr:MAG: MFS transporter [Candidatus Bathyarchaeota archaeon]